MERYLVTALALFSSACSASYQVGDARIIEVDGKPCFKLQREASMSQVRAVIIYDNSTQPSTKVWEQTIPNEATAPNCFKYDNQSGATQLLPGRTYETILSLRPAPNGDNTRFYKTEFCIINIKNPPHQKVHQVLWSDAEQKWDYAPCRLDSK